MQNGECDDTICVTGGVSTTGIADLRGYYVPTNNTSGNSSINYWYNTRNQEQVIFWDESQSQYEWWSNGSHVWNLKPDWVYKMCFFYKTYS